MLLGNIGFLKRIGFQIVEHRGRRRAGERAVGLGGAGNHELPPAVDHHIGDAAFRGIGEVGDVMGVGLHENGFARLHRCAVGEVQAGDVSGVLRAGDVEDGSGEIEDVRESFIVTGGLHLAGPADEHGRADAKFVGGKLRAVAFVGVGGVPAIVGEVEDHGVFLEAVFFQIRVHLAGGLVHPIDHRVVKLRLLGGPLATVFLEQPLGRVVRGVRQERRVPDEEGLFLRLGRLDEIIDRLHAFPPDIETRVAVAARGVRHAVGEAHLLVGSVPDLAGLESQVSGLGHGLGQREGISQQLLP